MRSRTPANGVPHAGSAASPAAARAAADSGRRRSSTGASWRDRRARWSSPASTLTEWPAMGTVRTYGCQMNVHDSERLAGLLEDAGYGRAGRPAVGRRRGASTPARSGRTPTTSSTATSVTSRRRRWPSPACRSPSVAASPRRTAARSSAGRRGWTSCSAPTTSGRCPRCWSAPGTTTRRRSRSSRRWRSSPRRCRPAASRPTPRWVSISVGCNNTCTFCIVPVAARQGARPPARRRCSPRSRRSSPRACSR